MVPPLVRPTKGLITTIAAALGLAMIFGFIASKLSMPPLVG
ncbi:MAG: hypothetical protein ABI724_00480 [Betaproteobacteria bacterium]